MNVYTVRVITHQTHLLTNHCYVSSFILLKNSHFFYQYLFTLSWRFFFSVLMLKLHNTHVLQSLLSHRYFRLFLTTAFGCCITFLPITILRSLSGRPQGSVTTENVLHKKLWNEKSVITDSIFTIYSLYFLFSVSIIYNKMYISIVVFLISL